MDAKNSISGTRKFEQLHVKTSTMASSGTISAAMATFDFKTLVAMAPIAEEESDTKKVKEQRSKVIALIRKMRKTSLSRIRKKKRRRVRHFHESIKMAQRVVLRSYGRVSVPMLLGVHRMFRNNSIRATKLLRKSKRGTMNTGLTCAVRASFEE